jgi:excinuclease ABC subunit C
LFQSLPFTSFGPPGLAGVSQETPTIVHGSRPGQLRARVRQDCTRHPGVYGMVNAAGELIYVGKAKSLRARLLGYFRPRSRDPKAGRIVADARALVWEPVATEFAALLRELELIHRWQPRFNVQGQPGRRKRTYVCLGRSPAPYVFLAARPPSTADACFGPVPASFRASEAVRRLNDWYRLRDCPRPQTMVFADQRELFSLPRAAGCIRHEIGNCLAPCAAECTRSEYSVQAQGVRRFLEGKDQIAIEWLTKEMNAASAAFFFEQAAALRDKLEALQWLADRLMRVRSAVRLSCVYPVMDAAGNKIWYLIHQGRVQAALPSPSNAASHRRAAALLKSVYRSPSHPSIPTHDEVDAVYLVAAWFRRYPMELARAMPPSCVKSNRFAG